MLPPAALLPLLLPETQRLLHQWAKRQPPPGFALDEPRWLFADLPPTTRLRYELVGWPNFRAYLPLFAADSSPYVDARFRNPAALEEYVAYLLTYARYSRKRGAADWLLRRRTNNVPLGALHLHELSQERVGDWRPHCAVGYALGAAHRGQGYATEALTHLLTQAATRFGQTEARATTAAANLPSQALLHRCGFAVLEQRPATRHREAEALWGKELGSRT